MKNKKIILNLLLSFIMAFVIGFGFSVKANVNKAHAVDEFQVSFKSDNYSEYVATINSETTYQDIVNAIKSEKNLPSNATMTFYLYYKSPDTNLQTIGNNNTKVLDVFNYQGANPSNYGNYYFRYEVGTASPSVVSYTCKGSLGYYFEFPLSYNLSLDPSKTTIGALREQLKYAVETDHEYWSVSEIKLYVDPAGNGELNDFTELQTDLNMNSVETRYTQSDIIYFGLYTESAPPRQFTGNLGYIEYSFTEDDNISFVKETLSSHLSDDKYYVVVNTISYGGQELADDVVIEGRGCNAVHQFTYTATKLEILSDHKTINFYDYNGTLIKSSGYTLSDNINPTDYSSYTPATGFQGWYCDTTKVTYTAGEMASLKVEDVAKSTNVVNFYAKYKRGDKYIEFTPVVDKSTAVFNYKQDSNASANDTILVESDTENSIQFTITYKITHNDGVNSILLLPDYDANKFAIKNVTVDGTTSLGAATLTKNGFDKILLESENVYSSKNDAFVTITYEMFNPIDGDYKFGFKLAPYVHNNVSESYYWVDGLKAGEQEELEIKMNYADASSIVKVIVYKDAQIEISDNVVGFVYNKTVLKASKVENFSETPTEVEYTYTGTAETQSVKWYEAVLNDNQSYVKGNELGQAPVSAGYYFVGVSADEDGIYHAVSEVTKLIRINPRVISITIADKTSVYRSSLAPLTYEITGGTFCTGDDYNPLVTDATVTSNVGNNYSIYVNQDLNRNYNFNYVAGKYTITPLAIKITAGDQEAFYSGSEPTVSQTNYTVVFKNDGNINGTAFLAGADASAYKDEMSVVLTKAAGVNVGTYAISPSITSGNYDLDVVNGTFTIKTVTTAENEISQYFSGNKFTYNGTERDLLNIASNTPSWITNHLTVEGRMQTHVNTTDPNKEWTISITHEFTDQQDANNYTNGRLKTVFTVKGKINPYAITITADSKQSSYGSTPLTLTPQKVNGVYNEEVFAADNGYYEIITVGLTVKKDNETITLTAETPVGEYNIVPSATNTDYIYTYNNGTYTVSKATAEVAISAQNIMYNRALEYTVTKARVNEISLTPTIVIKDSENEVVDVDENTVLDAGNYTIYAIIAGNDNYNGAEASAQFTISKVEVALPKVIVEDDVVVYEGIRYNGATVEWDAVTTDRFDKELYNTTITYQISGAPCNGREFTATSAEVYLLQVIPSNENYLFRQVELKPVWEVTFAEGNHNQNTTDEADGMPATQYRFDGEKATAPTTNPTIEGYTFVKWQKSGADYSFDTAVEANTTLTAVWQIKQHNVYIQYIVTEEENNVKSYVNTLTEAYVFDYNSKVQYSTLFQVPNYNDKDDVGIYYTFNNTFVLNEQTYTLDDNTFIKLGNDDFLVPDADVTFVAQYDINYRPYKVYYHTSQNGGSYESYGTPTEVTYGQPITYTAFSSNITWFTTSSWYKNQERTEAVLTVMPNHDINVYAGIVFNVGLGDVNGNGKVDVNDITLYRKWIVGGYEMTVIASGTEWATATDEDFDKEGTYFLSRVSDNNSDQSSDIRDVSVTRMALVGGYYWDIETGITVTGDEIMRNVLATDMTKVNSALTDDYKVNKVTLYNDITATEQAYSLTTSKNIYIDLGGKTLTLKSLTLVSTSYSTITVKNGTIVTENGVTIAAPNGNVVLENVTAYDKEGVINLAAANHSLHINKEVKFYQGSTNSTAKADVKVAKDTHVVVEPEGKLVVDKLIVHKLETNNQALEFKPLTAEEAEEIVVTININSTVAEAIGVGVAVVDDPLAETPTVTVVEVTPVKETNEIKTLEELLEVQNKGGVYTLTADITTDKTHPIQFTKDTELNLNGHFIRSTNDVAIRVVGHATLTINGDVVGSSVIAQEACVMTFDGATVVINGGTYTSIDNFVVGTNGSNGRGGNTITINAGTFNGGITSNGYIACGVYVANNDEVEIVGGTFNINGGVGVLLRAGNLTLDYANTTFTLTNTNNLVSGKVGDKAVNIEVGKVVYFDRSNPPYPGYDSTKDTITYLVHSNNKLVELNSRIADGSFDGHATILFDDKFDLTSNITFTQSDDASGPLTVDFNNYEITASGNIIVVNANVVFKNADLTVVDGKEIGADTNGTLTIENGHYEGKWLLNTYTNSSVLNIKDGEFVSKEMTVWVGLGGTANIEGGTFTALDNAVVGTPGNAGQGGNHITISGGVFNAYTLNKVSSKYPTGRSIACGIYLANDDVLVVEAGTFNVYGGVGILARAGQTFVGEDVEFNMYATNSDVEGVVDGYVGDSSYRIPVGQELVFDLASKYPGLIEEFVFENGTEYLVYAYAGSEDHIKIAKEYADVIVLGADIDLTSQVNFTKNVTLNLNGHKLYNTVDIWNNSENVKTWSLISVQAGKLTINGDGSLLAKANDCYAVDVRNGAELVINGGNYAGNISAVYVLEGALTVNGGYFYVQESQFNSEVGQERFVLNCFDANYKNGTAIIVVNGGSFKLFNPGSNVAEISAPEYTNFLGEGHTVTSEVVEEKTVYTVHEYVAE